MRLVVRQYGCSAAALLFCVAWACSKPPTPAQAWTAYQRGNLNAAVRDWTKILKQNPLSGEAYYGLGVAQEAQGDAAGAEHSLARCIDLLAKDPRQTDAFIRLTKLYMDRHAAEPAYLEAAAAMGDEVSRRNPAGFDGPYLLGRVALTRGNAASSAHNEQSANGWYRTAVELFRRAGSVQPNNADVLSYRALAWEGLGEFKSAEQDWTRALAADGRNAGAFLHLMSLHSERGDAAGALSLADRAISARPDDTAFLNELAAKSLTLLRLDVFRRVTAHLESIAARHKREPLELGRLYERSGMNDDALRAFTLGEGVENSEWAMYRRAAVFLLLRNHRYDEAAQRLELLQNKLPNDIEVQTSKASLMSFRGNPREAVAALEKITSAYPSNMEAELALARAYSRAGEKNRAVATLEMCKRLFPDRSEVLVELAGAYLSVREYKAADLTASSAIDLNNTCREAREIKLAAQNAMSNAAP